MQPRLGGSLYRHPAQRRDSLAADRYCMIMDKNLEKQRYGSLQDKLRISQKISGIKSYESGLLLGANPGCKNQSQLEFIAQSVFSSFWG